MRLLFFAIVITTSIALLWLMWHVLAPGGWDLAKLLILLCFAALVPWLGVCVGNAVPGFLVLVFARNPPRFALPVRGDIDSTPITLATAIAVTIRNEDMATVLPPQRALLDALAAHGHADRFTLWILSDTQDPQAAAAEEAAIAALRATHPLPERIRYRRRTANTGFKAGNVMDFLDRHAPQSGEVQFPLLFP